MRRRHLSRLHSRIAALVFLCCTADAVFAQACAHWGEAVHIGQLDLQLEEASGVAVSRRFPDRLYHINDSGDSGRFYITTMEGKNTTPVSIAGFTPIDTEAVSVGNCGDRRSCVFVGDIGDNDRRRETIDIFAIEEVEKFERTVKPVQRYRLRYPDKPHDAESMAVHPSGTIYILTKEQPARLFKFDPSSMTRTLAPVMTLDAGGRPTDMSISDDGTRLLVLTYRHAVEFGIDLEHETTPRYRQKIELRFLPQQEGVAYLPGSLSFIYTSERVILASWVMRVECARGK